MQPFRGLDNNGATCYLNSVVQALYQSIISRNSFIQAPVDEQTVVDLITTQLDGPRKSTDEGIIAALQALFIRMQTQIANSLNTKNLCYSLGMSNQDFMYQEDANELYKKILDRLDFFTNSYDKQHGTTSNQTCYKDVFEGQQESVVVCTNCKNTNRSPIAFTDLMCPIRRNVFECLASLLLPETVDGYRCDACGQTCQAQKLLSIKSVGQILAMSVQRFYYDVYMDNYKKDPSPVQFPIYLDTFILDKLDNLDLFDDQTYFEKRLAIVAEFLQVTMMPWLYFNIQDGHMIKQHELQADVDELVSRCEQFEEHFTTCYAGGYGLAFHQEGSGQVCSLPDFYTAPHCNNGDNESLYCLSAIICHMGSMNSGHYYTLFTQRHDHQNNVSQRAQSDTLQLYEANDGHVVPSGRPTELLNQICGTAESQGGMAGFGNTGYMYVYQRSVTAAAVQSKPAQCAVVQNAAVTQWLETTNERDAALQARCTIHLLSNSGSTNFQAAQGARPVTVSFDQRLPLFQLVDEYKAIAGPLQSDNIELQLVHDAPMALRRTFITRDLDRSIGEALGRPVAPELTVFIQLDCSQNYDYESTYLVCTSLRCSQGPAEAAEGLDVGGEQVIRFKDGEFDGDVASIFDQPAESAFTVAHAKVAICRQLLGANSELHAISKYCKTMLLYQHVPSSNYYILINEVGPENFVLDSAAGISYTDTTKLFYELVDGPSVLANTIDNTLLRQQYPGQTLQNLRSVSQVYNFILKLRDGYNVYVYDQDMALRKQIRLCRTDMGAKLRSEVDKIAGDSDFGHAMYILARHKDTDQLRKLLEITKDDTEYSIENLFQKAIQYKNSYITFLDKQSIEVSYCYIRPNRGCPSFTFLLANNNDIISKFTKAPASTQLVDKQTVQEHWNHFSRLSSSIKLFGEFNVMLQPISDLCFYYVDEKQAEQQCASKTFHSLIRSQRIMQHKFELVWKVFKNSFYIYVDVVCNQFRLFKQLFPAKEYGMRTLKILHCGSENICRIYVSSGMTVSKLVQFVQKICNVDSNYSVQVYAIHQNKMQQLGEGCDIGHYQYVELFQACL